jgi:hypothetical protein
MSEIFGVCFGAGSAHLVRTLCAKSCAHKNNRTSLVRARTPMRLVRIWRALSAHANAKPVRFAVVRNGR